MHSSRAAPLFLDTPRLEKLIALEKRRRSLHWLDLWRQVRGHSWKAVIDMRDSSLAYTLWAKRRFVYRSKRPPPGSPRLHNAAEAADVIGSLDRPPAPFLYASAQRQARADAGPLRAHRRKPLSPLGPLRRLRQKRKRFRHYEAPMAIEGYQKSCMMDLSVARVVGSARDLLERTGNAGADAAPRSQIVPTS